MTYFDESLELDPITEQQSTPVLPEERHVFELIGFERSQPDEFRKDGGVKWTWRVFMEDGQTPFVFNDEQYLFFRTTNIDKKTRKPLFSVGTDANDWASAMLGRTLGVDAHFRISDLHGKRMSAMVVWERQKRDKTKWTTKLASLRYVPVSASTNGHAPIATPSLEKSVSADPSSDEIDRALSLSKFDKKIERAKKKKLPSLATFIEARAAIDATTTAGQVDALIESLDDALDKMDEDE